MKMDSRVPGVDFVPGAREGRSSMWCWISDRGSSGRMLQNVCQCMHPHCIGRGLRSFCALFQRRRHTVQFRHVALAQV